MSTEPEKKPQSNLPPHIRKTIEQSWANPPEGLKPVNLPKPGDNK